MRRVTSKKSGVARTTFGGFADEWTSGKLHKRFSEHVPLKDSTQDKSTLRLYVIPQLQETPVRELTLDDVDRVMANLPEKLGSASRRHVAQVVRRTLALAVYPARLLSGVKEVQSARALEDGQRRLTER